MSITNNEGGEEYPMHKTGNVTIKMKRVRVTTAAVEK